MEQIRTLALFSLSLLRGQAHTAREPVTVVNFLLSPPHCNKYTIYDYTHSFFFLLFSCLVFSFLLFSLFLGPEIFKEDRLDDSIDVYARG